MGLRCLLVITGVLLWGQDKPAYLFYTPKGKQLSYKQVLQKLKTADVVLFGEIHNNPIAHWLQYELLKDLHIHRPQELLLGMEMLETDQQQVITRYLRGEIASLEDLSKETKLWPNFRTDYAPLIEYARTHNIPVYATNAPRHIVRQVSQKGLVAMQEWTPEMISYIAPLPIARLDSLRSYQQLYEIAQQHGMDPNSFRLAQMLKDATMAHRIAQAWRQGFIFFHINGRYHSDYHEGIAAYLRLYNPKLNVVVITTEEFPEPEAYKPQAPPLADIILVVPQSMTKTH
ncbi:MAG: ChaN family lipoprotein [Bacteroidia bacterium]|nr:ChaN family lipoprotein [Bacteroidia bacterium]MDW8133980.1 ChaN family lipoprotein [Bacteroidia bacterium]